MNLCRHWGVSDPLLPQISLSYPKSLDLGFIEDEMLLSAIPRQDSCASDYLLEIKQFPASPKRFSQNCVVPVLSRVSKSVYSPKLVYDLAAICYKSESHGCLLIDRSIGGRRSYFLNCIMPLLVHAAIIRNCVQLHAALVQWHGKGVLVPGNSGAGKSTLGIMSVCAGQKIITDDQVLVGPVDGDQWGRSLRKDFFLRGNTYDILPNSMQNSATIKMYNGEQKYILRRNDIADQELLACGVDYLILPSIGQTHGDCPFELKPLPKTLAFRELLQLTNNSILLDSMPNARSSIIRSLQNLVKGVRCLSLKTSPTFLTDVETNMDKLIAKVLNR